MSALNIGMAVYIKTLLTPCGLIEDVNIPRGRKGGFIPKGGVKIKWERGSIFNGN